MLVRGLPNRVDPRIANFLDQDVSKSVVSNCAREEGRTILAHHPLTDAKRVQSTAARDELDSHLLNELLVEGKMPLVSKDGVVRLKAISMKIIVYAQT